MRWICAVRRLNVLRGTQRVIRTQRNESCLALLLGALQDAVLHGALGDQAVHRHLPVRRFQRKKVRRAKGGQTCLLLLSKAVRSIHCLGRIKQWFQYAKANHKATIFKANTKQAQGYLLVDSGIPVAVIEDHGISRGQVDAKAASASAK